MKAIRNTGIGFALPAAAVAVAACWGGSLAECDCPDEPEDFIAPEGNNPGLRQAEDCDQVADALRQQILEGVKQRMQEQRDAMIRRKLNPGLCSNHIAGSDGDADADWDDGWVDDWDDDWVDEPDGPGEYTTTNNQEAGVDEADFVKNDGSHIYLLADGRFQILDAWPPEQAHRVSATPITGEPRKMFVHEGMAVIYSSLPHVATGDQAFDQAAWSECTYGFDCELVGDGRPMRIAVYDLADLAAPRLVRQIETDGSLLAARRVGGTAFTAVVHPEPVKVNAELLGLATMPPELEPYRWRCGNDIPFTVCQIETLFGELLLRNRDLIAALDPELMLPWIGDRVLEGGQWAQRDDVFEECRGFWLSASGDGLNIISLLSFDPAAGQDLAITSVLGRPGAVYAGTEALYVAARHTPQDGRDWFFPDDQDVTEASTVHKFALDHEAMTSQYLGSGVVKGRVLNQFSMSEREGFLRIATQTRFSPHPLAHATVSVLTETVGGLILTGQVDNIAPAEDTRAVRFIGDRGYVVTFMVQTGDPLFVIDLANPHDPQMLGELHIPGFSTYLHPLGLDHLLTIGYEAENMNEMIRGIALQIIDVTEPTNPLLTHKQVIGSYGTASEAATNHLGFNYFPSRNQLAVPVTICDYEGDQYGMTFSGLQVWNVTVDDGFSLIGGLAHEEPVFGSDYWQTCGQFWTSATSAVKRSIFMDDYVYSIAPELVLAAAVDALDEPLASIDLTAP